MKNLLKKIAIGFMTFCFGMNTINAQAPSKFNYQAVARDGSGNILANRSVGIRFTIHEASPIGITTFQETQTQSTNALGLFNTSIGSGTAVTGTVGGVNWGSGAKYLQVEIDPNGGTNYTVSGASQLLSVPYALYAAQSGSGTANYVPKFTTSSTIGNSTIYDNGSSIGIGTTSPTGKVNIVNNASGLSGTSLIISNANTGGIAISTSTNSADANLVINNANQAGLMAKFFNGQASQAIDMKSNGSAGMIDVYGDGTGSANGGFVEGNNPYGLILGDQTGGRHAIANLGGTTTANALTPWLNGTFALGNSTFKWTAVWAVNGTVQTSDERTKQNIKPVNYGLSTIMQLNPVSWNWKDKTAQLGTGTNLGFIAQEVEKIIPDVIVHTKTTPTEIDAAKKEKGIDIEKDTYGVKYAEFTPVMVKAIQEQQIMIEDLKKQIEELKAKSK